MKNYYKKLEKKDYAKNAILRRHKDDPAIMEYQGNNPFIIALRKAVKAKKYYTIMNNKKFYIANLAVVTSFDCNLNCNGCGQHTPQIKKLSAKYKRIDMEQVCCDLDKISDAVDGIGGIALANGEGFLNLNLEKLIDYYAQNTKIMNMNVPTNGSVIPTEDLLIKMHNNNVSATITKYDVISEERRREVIDLFKQYEVIYTVFEDRKWFSHEYLSDYISSDEEAHLKYCACERFFMLIQGRLWKCVPDATRVFAGIREEKEGESILVKNATVEEIREFLWEKTHLPYLESCLHCRGYVGSMIKEIPVGEQIERAKSPGKRSGCLGNCEKGMKV